MVTCLPTDPLRAAALAVTLAPADMDRAALNDACILVLTRGHTLGPDASRAIAAARRLSNAIARGDLA